MNENKYNEIGKKTRSNKNQRKKKKKKIEIGPFVLDIFHISFNNVDDDGGGGGFFFIFIQ